MTSRRRVFLMGNFPIGGKHFPLDRLTSRAACPSSSTSKRVPMLNQIAHFKRVDLGAELSKWQTEDMYRDRPFTMRSRGKGTAPGGRVSIFGTQFGLTFLRLSATLRAGTN
jgi:hypothetical protein